MKQKVFLIHGWSVQETTTYQALHLKLAEHGFDLDSIFLGRYVSLEDQVEIGDIAKALHRALDEKLNGNWRRKFHIITHSTGALVARHWVTHHYYDKFAAGQPLRNLVFLAGPHFGSRLAHHGRAMLANALYLGDTGRNILNALELGSAFSWKLATEWLDADNWKAKGIRPYCLAGDAVKRRLFNAKIFPAAYETGSDMVVRVPAANLNFQRFEFNGHTRRIERSAGIKDIPFAALADFIHSGAEHGIMNSITGKATPTNHLALQLILDCLAVRTARQYRELRKKMTAITAQTRKTRQGFAQLDFRFLDEEGRPVNDFVFKLGVMVGDMDRPSKTVAHTHKNKNNPNHFTVFINLKELEPEYNYFIEFETRTASALYTYTPDPFRTTFRHGGITDLVVADQTTQVDVILSREPSRNLFVFHRGDDESLHLGWDRSGTITATGIPPN